MMFEWTPLLIGVGLAIGMAVVGAITRFDRDRSFYPTVLIVIATYYVLFAFMSGEAIVTEVLVASLFSSIAIAGGLAYAPLVGLGILLHGVFDFAHASFIVNSGVPRWWPAFCAGVDIPLGIWVLYLAYRGRPLSPKSP